MQVPGRGLLLERVACACLAAVHHAAARADALASWLLASAGGLWLPGCCLCKKLLVQPHRMLRASGCWSAGDCPWLLSCCLPEAADAAASDAHGLGGFSAAEDG